MARPQAPRPPLVLPLDRLPEPFRSLPALLEAPPWSVHDGKAGDGTTGLRAYASANACHKVRQQGQEAARTLSHASPGDWRALFAAPPACPWDIGLPEERKPSAPPLLLSLCWRYGWVQGVLELLSVPWRAETPFTIPRTIVERYFYPWASGLLDSTHLPASNPDFIPLNWQQHWARVPAWPTFIRRELNVHDSNGNRISATHYWPDASKIPV